MCMPIYGSANTDRSYSFVKRKKKYPWDICIQCATKQNQKSQSAFHGSNKRQYELFQKQSPKQNKNASDTFTTLNLKRPTCARLLTPCKCRWSYSFVKEENENIRETSAYNAGDRTKPKTKKCAFHGSNKRITWFFSKTNFRNKTQNASHTFTTLNLNVQHVHAYLRPANTDRSYSFVKEEKRKYLVDIHMQCAWINQNHKVHFKDRTRQ